MEELFREVARSIALGAEAAAVNNRLRNCRGVRSDLEALREPLEARHQEGGVAAFGDVAAVGPRI